MIKKVLQIPLGGHRRRKRSDLLTPGSEAWVSREAPLKVAKWKSKTEFAEYMAKDSGRPDLLDKLAVSSQPAMVADSAAQKQRDGLKKRAEAKYYSDILMKALLTLDSPLKKSYLNTLYCATELKQVGDKVTAVYCKNRHCMVCNRIRTGKMHNQYEGELKTFADAQMVTLTIRTMGKKELRPAILKMGLTWSAIYKKLHKHCKKAGIKLRGLRKFECTYNAKDDKYHPHFHILVEGKGIAEMIYKEWMAKYPMETYKDAQDIRPANTNAPKELFKYLTKIVSDDTIYIPALDVIFQSIRGCKIYQSFGVKPLDDNIDELDAITVEDLIDEIAWWKWNGLDWVHTQTGEGISGFNDTRKIDKITKNIIL